MMRNIKKLLVVYLLLTAMCFAKEAKYVFLFIGDGTSMVQIDAADTYLKSIGDKEQLNFLNFPAQGITKTPSADAFITDSAAAGTALATGYKTNSGVIAMDPSKQKSLKTIAEMAKEKRGMKVGIITSVSLDHATPATFYAHEATRKNYYEIASQLAKSDFDYFAGGGLNGNTVKKRKGRKDVIEIAKENGFTYVDTKDGFESLKQGAGKVIAVNPDLTGGEAMRYEIDRDGGLSLADYTKKGIELLEDSENGFFMMVESGKIDWACHANDAAASIQDVIAFNRSIDEAVKFYNEHPEETLIVVTGDHETGGLTIGFSGTKYGSYFDKIKNQKVSYEMFDQEFKAYKKENMGTKGNLDEVMTIVDKNFGLKKYTDKEIDEYETAAKEGNKIAEENLGLALSRSEIEKLKSALAESLKETKESSDEDYLLYGGYEPFTITLTHILNNKAGIGWTTYSHTGVPVPTFAKGTGEEIFNGYYDNTDIAKKLIYLMFMEL